MAEDLPIRGSLRIPAGELAWRFSRSGGPGGQGVNTADSRVELSWDLARTQALPARLQERALHRLAGRLVDGVLTVVASEHRAQLQNRRAALTRLAAVVREAIAPPPRARRPTRPTAASVRARLDTKRRHGRLKRGRQAPPE
jgi:ribosome-associated protein